MSFALSHCPGWHANVLCVPTALSAISGLPVVDVVTALVAAATARGVTIAPNPASAFNINDWLQVIKDLGGSWTETKNYSQLPYAMRFTISDYLNQNTTPYLRLVFGENAPVTETHVFAMAKSHLVDTYTAGQIVIADPAAVPASYNAFRVKRVFAVSRP